MNLYEKIMSAYGLISDTVAGKMSAAAVAPKFRESASYSDGDLVVKDNILYLCKNDHSGVWDDADFVQATVADALAYNLSTAIQAVSSQLSEQIAQKASLSYVNTELAQKASVDDLSYTIEVKSPTGASNDILLDDRTINVVYLSGAGANLVLPAYAAGKSRSLFVKVIADAGQVLFSNWKGRNGESIMFETVDAEGNFPQIEGQTGTYLFKLLETEPHVFAIKMFQLYEYSDNP